MSRVKVLDKHTAELIAAGEVVERPASVVKELVENSIDAGASMVTVEIKNGGVSYIRITDDGCGIAREDVPIAFLRHATSKISAEDDLEAIATLGFRGEALASIAAVSRVELLTHSEQEQEGTRYIIEGGEEVSIEDWGCAVGTTIIIRDIFYNTPARMKFLKKDVSEGNAVASILDRIALSHPEVSVRFIRDGKQCLSTAGDNSLKSAIYSVFGKSFTQGLIPVEYSYNNVRVSGFVSSPENARPNRSMQTFFINGRYCRSVTMQTALENAFKGQIMTGRHPACVLGIEMSCAAVDVNVHPAKLEVRFTNEKPIYDSVYYGVKSALSAGEQRPELKLAQKPEAPPVQERTSVRMPEYKPPMPEYKPPRIPEPTVPSAPASPSRPITLSDPHRRAFIDVEYTGTPVVVLPDYKLPEVPERVEPQTEVIEPAPMSEPVIISESAVSVQETFFETKPESRTVGEAFSTYIFLERGDELIIIDKHAAHERIIYERLRSSETGREPQMLLTTVLVSLEKMQYDALINNLDILSEAGFEIDDFGSGTLAVRCVPSILDGCDITATLSEIAENIGYRPGAVSTQALDDMYHTMACRAAMKAGDKLHECELEELVRILDENPELRHCPHGRPIAITLTKHEIERKFKRV